MKLLNREPTKEMYAACNNERLARVFWHKLYDAAPEIKIDMEPVDWLVFKQKGGMFLSRVKNPNDAKYWTTHGCHVEPRHSANQVASLQAENERLTVKLNELSAVFQELAISIARGDTRRAVIAETIAKYEGEKHG